MRYLKPFNESSDDLRKEIDFIASEVLTGEPVEFQTDFWSDRSQISIYNSSKMDSEGFARLAQSVIDRIKLIVSRSITPYVYFEIDNGGNGFSDSLAFDDDITGIVDKIKNEIGPQNSYDGPILGVNNIHRINIISHY